MFSAKRLASLRSVFFRYFAATMLLYLSVALLMRYDARTSDSVYQSTFVVSMKQLKVEFVPDYRSLKICQTQY